MTRAMLYNAFYRPGQIFCEGGACYLIDIALPNHISIHRQIPATEIRVAARPDRVPTMSVSVAGLRVTKGPGQNVKARSKESDGGIATGGRMSIVRARIHQSDDGQCLRDAEGISGKGESKTRSDQPAGRSGLTALMEIDARAGQGHVDRKPGSHRIAWIAQLRYLCAGWRLVAETVNLISFNKTDILYGFASMQDVCFVWSR